MSETRWAVRLHNNEGNDIYLAQDYDEHTAHFLASIRESGEFARKWLGCYGWSPNFKGDFEWMRKQVTGCTLSEASQRGTSCRRGHMGRDLRWVDDQQN